MRRQPLERMNSKNKHLMKNHVQIYLKILKCINDRTIQLNIAQKYKQITHQRGHTYKKKDIKRFCTFILAQAAITKYDKLGGLKLD